MNVDPIARASRSRAEGGQGPEGRAALVRPTVVGVIGLAAIVAMGMWRVAPRIELQLTGDVDANALRDLPEVRVRFDGRDAVLTGRITSDTERLAVIAAVRRRWGVRVVDADGLVAISEGVLAAPRTRTARPVTVARSTVSPSTISPSTVSPSTVSPSTVSRSTVSPSTVPPTTAGPTTAAPVTISPATLDGLDQRFADALTTGPIRFAKSNASADPASGATLDRIAALIVATPGPLVRIQTHTDGTGPTQANALLSQKRADALRTALIARGVPEARLMAEGLGESQPIASDLTDAGRQRNRRVVIRAAR